MPKSIFKIITLDSQFLKFCIVGVINSTITYLAFFAIISFTKSGYVIASMVGYILGVINSYFWNKYWTFKKREKSLSEFLKFVIVYVVSYLVNLVTLIILIEFLFLPPLISEIFGIGSAVIISFWGQRNWSFI